MRQSVRIFVEGKEDKYFLKSYIKHLDCNRSVSEIEWTGGWSNLEGYCPRIERRLDEGEKVLIIFDSDEDYKKRKSKIEKTIRTKTSRGISSKNSHLDIFLFPNNQLPGKIEHLLEEIVIPEHKKIFNCFENYKECLKEKNVSYQLPDIKGKIYSYKEALGVMEEKEENRFKPEYWDFQNSSLLPLKNFLLEYLS